MAPTEARPVNGTYDELAVEVEVSVCMHDDTCVLCVCGVLGLKIYQC